MPTLRIGKGIEPGAYEVTLQHVSSPKTIYPANEPDGVQILEWQFIADDGTIIDDSTSMNTGPRSKMYGWLTALNNGKAPAVDEDINTDDLLGRRVIANVALSEKGWPKITSLSAIPLARQQQKFAEATQAPTRPTRPQAVPRPSDGVPF